MEVYDCMDLEKDEIVFFIFEGTGVTTVNVLSLVLLLLYNLLLMLRGTSI